MRINLQKYSFRFAEQVLNSKLALKQEVKRYLPHFKSAIQVPIYVIGLDF